VLAAAAWVAVVVLARRMGSMPGTMGLGLVAFAAVWALMMAAMMLPSVAPFAAVYARTFTARPRTRRLAFVSGYLAIWAATAVPVYAFARAADTLVANHPAAATSFAAVTFAVCGAYQLTTLKDRCLAWCRSPLGFTAKYSGYHGRTRDFRVGAHHGAYCLGCCWALAAVLLAFGVMNVAAMLGVTLVVWLERTQPWGPRLGRFVGAGAFVLALAVIVHPALAPGLHSNPSRTNPMNMDSMRANLTKMGTP
jgi:predicted metal-binding membrane protein